MSVFGTESLKRFAESDFRAKAEEGDYMGGDGLLYCGKCGTPKECRVPSGAGGRDVVRPVQCRCVSERFERREREREESLRRAAESARRRRCFDIPGLSGFTFEADDSRGSKASAEARAYAGGFTEHRRSGSGLIFLGGVGCGKTFYAACIANDLFGRGLDVKVTSLSILTRRMAEDYGKGFSRVLGELERCDAVVIDDLGTERSTPTANECCYQIVNTLTTARVPMIITSNMSVKELGRESGGETDRIYSRIIERCKPVVMTGGDRRKA